LYLHEQFNAIEKILPAPLAINLLSQIVLIAADGPDFSVICPTGGCKHLLHSDSFKASLLQLSFGAYDAFNAAHVNMDTIDLNMRSLPQEVRFSLITLLQGSDEDIELILPDQLTELKRIAQKSRQSAADTVEAFTVVKDVLEELVRSATATDKDSKDKVKTLDLQIKAEQKRAKELEYVKKEAKERRDKVKNQLEKAETNWEKALDDLPDGWTMLGMQVSESLTNAFINIVDLVTLNVGKLFGEEEEQEDDKKDNETKPDASLEFPSCNLVPDRNSRVTITEKLSVAINFQTAVMNMKVTIEQLEQYVDSIFVKPSPDKLSLSPEAESITITVRDMLKPSKDQIENSGENSIPMAMRGTAVTFYKKLFDFMEEVIKAAKNRGTAPLEARQKEWRDLEKKAKDLSDNGQCFNSWLIKLLNLPPVAPKVPFKENKDEKTTANTVTEKHVENAKRRVEEWKNQMEDREEAFKEASTRLRIVSHNITETIIKLAAFDASKATLEEVLEILEEALEKLSALRTHWLTIREFFQSISVLVDDGVGNDVDKYVRLLDNGRKSIRLRKKYFFKNKIFANIQDINTKGHLVRKLSTTYLRVSDDYILPPVRKLGEMLEADPKESKRLRAQIAAETKKASREMSSILEAQQEEFLDSMKKRRDELENIYRPIFEQIPEERQREIEEEVKAVSAEVPPALIEQRTRTQENRENDGLQGSVESFLDL